MIGGEFEIDLSTRSDSFVPMPDTYYYASGRSALYQILKSIKTAQHKIWLPDYLCHTIVEAVEKAGWEYDFYELTNDLKASIPALDKKDFKNGSVVLLINYFGLQDLTISAEQIKSEYSQSIVIEDDVQAFFCFYEDSNPYADYRFTSLRKTLPVPDGGLVYTKNHMPEASLPNLFARYKVEAGVMKFNRGSNGIKDEDYLALFETGERLIDDSYESEMSFDSKCLFPGVDLEAVKRRRRANAAFLLEGLQKRGIEPLIDVPRKCTPLFIPILLDKRDEVRKRMFRHEVFCPVHWPHEGRSIKKGKEMAKYELSLIVDQRYSYLNMDMLLSQL